MGARIFVGIAVLVACGPAWAGPTRQATAVIALDQETQRSTLALGEVLARWSEQSSEVTHVDLAELARSAQLADRRQKADDAKRAYDRGIEAHDMMGYDDALAAFGRAAELYEHTDMTKHLKDLLDVYAAKVLALFYSGRLSEARQQLEHLYSLDSRYDFDPGRISPEISTLITEVQAQVASAPPTTLEIQTDPVAKVFVDGRFRGTSPIEVRRLTAGYHFVTIMAPGYAIVQERQMAAPGRIAKFSLPPANHARDYNQRVTELRQGMGADDVSPAAVRTLKWAQADELMVFGLERLSKDVYRVKGWRVGSDGHLRNWGEKEIPASGRAQPSELLAFASELMSIDKPRGENGEAITRKPGLFDGLSKLKMPDFGFGGGMSGATLSYITIGLGAATLGTGAVFGGMALGTASEAKGVPQLHDAVYQETLAKARGQALTADLLVGLGALVTGAGVYLLMGSGGDAAAPEGEPSAGAAAEKEQAAAPGGVRDLTVGVAPTPGGGAVLVQGRF